MQKIKLTMMILILFLIPAISYAGGEKGIFKDGTLQSKTDSLVATAATDTITGYAISFFGASDLGGDLTIVIKSTLNSGTYTTCTVSIRKYYDADLGYGSWFDVGTFSSDGTHEFNVASSASWYFCLGYQVRVTAASGTFNVSLVGKAFNR